MSVTFQLQDQGAVIGYKILYWCLRSEQTTQAVKATVENVASTHTSLCEECKSYGGPIIEAQYLSTSVNMANTNASMVLDLLGHDTNELYGSESGEEFLGRVLIALGLTPEDEGRPTVVDGNLTECGTPPGYKHSRLNQLHELAVHAVNAKTTITWA